MKTVTATPSLVLPLGRMGENEYTKIKFDVSGWLNELPAATIGLYNQRPQDVDAYPVDGITVEDGIVTWTITSAELAQVGKGRCELVAVENNVVAKSAIYNTIIFDALDGSGEAPDPWDSWQQTFVALKAEAVAAAQDAETAAEHYPRIVNGIWQVWDVQTGGWVSTGVKAIGEDYVLTEADKQEIGHMYDDLLTQTRAAKAAAETAKGLAETAQTAAETAQAASETAQGATENAQTGAETAQANAETAAEAAADYRDIAEGHAQDAGDNALVSEGFAKGTQNGQAVSIGSPYYENNAKYYKEATEEIAEGIAQEETAELILNAAQGTLAALQQLVSLQAMIRYYDELPDEGTEGYTYITPDGTYHYVNGEYVQLSGSGDLNGFSLRLDERGRVVLDYVNPEDDTDTGTATLPGEDTGLEIVEQLRQINASLYRLAGNTEADNG